MSLGKAMTGLRVVDAATGEPVGPGTVRAAKTGR
jgi:hypothetical protein